MHFDALFWMFSSAVIPLFSEKVFRIDVEDENQINLLQKLASITQVNNNSIPYIASLLFKKSWSALFFHPKKNGMKYEL